MRSTNSSYNFRRVCVYASSSFRLKRHFAEIDIVRSTNSSYNFRRVCVYASSSFRQLSFLSSPLNRKMKGGKACDYRCYWFSSTGSYFYYKKTANSKHVTVNLCARGTHCKPYNEVCAYARVNCFGMICNECAEHELGADFSLNDAGHSTVSFTDPTSPERRRITIKLSNKIASKRQIIPPMYRSMLGNVERALKVYNDVSIDNSRRESRDNTSSSCCCTGCNTRCLIPNCYCS